MAKKGKMPVTDCGGMKPIKPARKPSAKPKEVSNCGGIKPIEPMYTIDDYKDRMTCPFGITLIDPKTGKPIKDKSKPKATEKQK